MSTNNDREDTESALTMDGTVTKILNGSMCRVNLDNGLEVLGHLSGKMRKFGIRIAIGDRVAIEISPYDLSKGRITYRHKT